MAPSSTNANSNTLSSATSAAMTLINNPEAMALLQGTSPSSNGSTDMSNANNMLVNGRASNTRLGATSGPLTSGAGGSTSAPPMQKLPRPSSTARGNVAAFLTKLYNMVSDDGSNNLIKWSDDGQSFIVLKHVEFAKEVLPKFFKHNNFSSFVRQLNMYGFHKVPHLQQGVLLPESDTEQWEFSNPHFQKNQPDLLCLVSRKKASGGNDDKDALTMDLGNILQEVTAIKKHQIAISADLKNIERDHQSLWQEAVAARERHQRQQETIDKILRFLASVFSGDKKRAIVHKRPRLTITEGGVDEDAESDYYHGSGEEHEHEHEEEVVKLLGNKRKRASMVESEVDLLPGIEAQGSPNTKPTLSASDLTPATLTMLANATQALLPSSAPTSSLGNPILTSVPASAPGLASTSSFSTPMRALPTVSGSSGALPDYLTTFPTTGYPAQPFKLDSANLGIPTALLPDGISSAHHDMLRSISMANAQESAPAPLPPSFAQTPAGASAIKGVEDIAKEMERLQRSIEALEAHGLNVDSFHLDDSYLSSGAFDPDAYGDLSGISGSGVPYQDHLGHEGEGLDDLINTDHDDLHFIPHQDLASTMTASSSPNTHSPALSAASTSIETSGAKTSVPMAEEEYLEGLLKPDAV